MKISIILLALLILISACSTTKPAGETEAEVLYKESLTLIEEEHYLLATEKLNTIKAKFPYSYFSTHAELLLADILFKQENFAEAAAAYILFKDFHPKHQRINYVTWKIAESYFNQIPSTSDRDLFACNESMKYYEEILNKFADSEFSKDASVRISHCRSMLLKKERDIADFYFKTKDFESAKHRYLDIIENFTDNDLLSHAMKRVVNSYFFLKDYKACATFFEKFSKYMVPADLTQATNISAQCVSLNKGADSERK